MRRGETITRPPTSDPQVIQQYGNARSAFIGTWKLRSIEDVSPNGEKSRPFGSDAFGIMTCDGNGHVSVEIGNRNPSDEPPAREPDDRWGRSNGGPRTDPHIQYSGTYSVRAAEGIVVHHVETSPYRNLRGTSLRRYFQFSGDRVILTAVAPAADGGQHRRILVWERES